MLHIVYFARIREALGIDGEAVAVETSTSISVLLDQLAQRSERHAQAFADRGKLRFALDHMMVPVDTVLGHAKELAIFPPVTGG